MATPTDDPIIIATADIVLPSGSNNKKVPEAAVLTNGYGIEALPLNDLNYIINNHGLWLTYIKDEVVPSVDITNWNQTSTLLADAANITPSGTYPDQDQNFQSIVEQGAGRSVKTINNGTSGVDIKVTYPANQEAPQSYFNGMRLLIDVGGAFSGGTNCTLELNSLGSKPLYAAFHAGASNADFNITSGLFNYPTEVYFHSTLDAFTTLSAMEDRNLVSDSAIDIVSYGYAAPLFLGGPGDITLSHITGGTFNYGKLLSSTIDYSTLFTVGQVITISGLTGFLSPSTALDLSGTYQIQAFSDGGLGMSLRDYNGGSGGDVENVQSGWTQVPPASDNISTSATATPSLTNRTVPHGLRWLDFEKLEVLTAGESTPNLVSNLGIVPRELMGAYPESFESKVFTASGNSAGIVATSITTFDINQNNDVLVSVKGYLRRSFI